MKIYDLLPRIKSPALSEGVDLGRELTPTLSAEGGEGTLLFVHKRVGGGYSVPEGKISGKPAAVVCDREYAAVIEGIPTVSTDDPRAAYAHACYLHNGIKPRAMRLVALTGTNGKTTTATMLHAILTHAGMRCGLIGTGMIRTPRGELGGSNYSMTTPDPEQLYSALALMQREGCDAVVMEASSHSIALGKLSPLHFERGIFTNLSHEHMDFHTDIEDYFAAKLSLFDMCDGGIYNMDDKYGALAYELSPVARSGVGIINPSDAYVTDVSYNGLYGSSFLYRQKGLLTRVELRLPGAFNVYNAAMAMRCAVEMGVTPRLAREALGALGRVEGRMETVHESPRVIIDYAHTPEALENVLKVLKQNKTSRQKLSIVFGCGGCRDKEKRPLMAKVAEKYADRIYLTEDNSRNEDLQKILADIVSGFSPGALYTVTPDRRLAIERALGEAGADDIVAIVGKGHERYMIDSDGTHPFDERKIISDFFSGGGGEK